MSEYPLSKRINVYADITAAVEYNVRSGVIQSFALTIVILSDTHVPALAYSRTVGSI